MEAGAAVHDHGDVLVPAIALITAALVLYTTGVWSERRVGRLRWRHAALFGGGLVLDASGTALMTLIAADFRRNSAGGAAAILNDVMVWTGAAALALMAVRSGADSQPRGRPPGVPPILPSRLGSVAHSLSGRRARLGRLKPTHRSKDQP